MRKPKKIKSRQFRGVCPNVNRSDTDWEQYERTNKPKLSDVPQAFCQYCNQEACDGGMVGSMQECETIRMLKDVIDEVVDEKTSDREERKIVGWISHIECGIHGNMQYWVCSKCKELFSHDAETGIAITDYRFCPNCGAEMKGVVE